MKQLFLSFLLMLLPMIARADSDVQFSLSGLQTNDIVHVTISSNEYIKTMEVVANGNHIFSGVPVGQHYLKVEANGYNLPDAKVINVNNDGSISPQSGINLVITKMNSDGVWSHSWHEDGSTSGYTTTSYVNKPSSITFLGRKIVPANVPSQSILESEHHIVLSDDGETWTQEYAYRLLETMKTMPINILGTDNAIIKLTQNHITDDIQIETVSGGIIVTLSSDAFAYANPFLVNLDGVRGRFYSKRLHHAIVSMVTNLGNNRQCANRILSERFGCSIYPPNIADLTKSTTNETAENFQDFVPRELVEIVNMFEEMPEGFHKIKNLKYLIRRQNGHDHPLYPSAAAVTWPQEDGYIEFMEKAFNNENIFDVQRLIIHEKTHMLWEYTFSNELKNDWVTLGGWYPDPNAASGWSTTKTTEFVSAYAHAINPNEDMAESVAFYIKNPDMLQSRSLPKYEFIRDRIMHGTRYISRIREDLTFEVLNLFPDYDYPGKIKSLDVKVEGKPDEDKIVNVDVTLNHMDGFNDGAIRAFLRMTSPCYKDTKGDNQYQIRDLYLYPVNGDAWHLQGQLTLSKYSKSGYWTVGDIKVSDEQDNQRFEGNNDFVWNMYVNNSLEDLESPVYEKGSLRYNLTDVEVDGHQAKNLEVIYKVTDDIGISSTFVRLSRSSGDSYTFKDEYGTYDPETHEAHVNFLITEYYPTDDYYASHITFYDLAQTGVVVDFSDSPQHELRKTIHIETTNPDTQYPELDLNRIFVYAEPTNPSAPDGETLVTINYYARDDKSGLGKVDFRLRDPQGIDHFEYHYHRNFYSNYFDGDPTVWERYIVNIVLPKGSAPGIWGLSELTLNDKALNWHTYNFVETLIFEPDENQNDYILFAEMTSEDMLNFDLTAISGNPTGYSFVYRIINEETGHELSGVITDINQSDAPRRRVSGDTGYNIDVSSLPYGKLVVIVQVKDTEGKVVAVRSTTINRIYSTQYSLTYMVDGIVYKTVLYDYDSPITPEAIPIKDGYIFSGWSEIPETMPAHDVIVTGKFDINVNSDIVVLDKSEVIVKKNKTVILTPTVYPLTLENKSVKWQSSDTKVATVTSSGKVKGVKTGIATITCTSVATGAKATCKVIVGTITLNKSEVIVKKNKTVTLTPTVYPTTLEDKSVKWKSSDKTIATVTSSGKVKGVKCGTATITCTSVATGLSATCKVTVATITLNKSEVIVKKNKTVKLTPTVYPTTLEDKSVTWKSSDETIATVASDGTVKGIKTGIVTITCTSVATGLSTTCQVIVGTITLNKSTATVAVKGSVTLKATVYPTTLEDQSVKWKSSDTDVATVSKTGKVTGVGEGTSTITCTSVATGLSATCKITVKPASARTLDEEDAELTDIEIVETPAVKEPVDVYDLGGRQVLQRVTSLDGLPAGVYIVNGKKVLKK